MREWNRGEDSQVLVSLNCSQTSGDKAKQTKQNKTWRKFRGELPGYRQNAQRLYNECLKTFPSGSFSSTHSHTMHACKHTTSISTKCKFKKMLVSGDHSVTLNLVFCLVHFSLLKTLTYSHSLIICFTNVWHFFFVVMFQYYFTVTFNHDNQKALELRTEDIKDCDEWVAAITQAR